MKKYEYFIVEKLNIEQFDNDYHILAEELDGFWNKLKSKVTQKVNNESIDSVETYNNIIREKRKKEKEENEKKDKIKPLEHVKSESETKKKEIVPDNKDKVPLSDRQLNFKKDANRDLRYKAKLDNYKEHRKKIEDKLKQREENKRKKEEKRRKDIEENKRNFEEKQKRRNLNKK